MHRCASPILCLEREFGLELICTSCQWHLRSLKIKADIYSDHCTGDRFLERSSHLPKITRRSGYWTFQTTCIQIDSTFLFLTAFYLNKITMHYNFPIQPEQFDMCWTWVQSSESQSRKMVPDVCIHVQSSRMVILTL